MLSFDVGITAVGSLIVHFSSTLLGFFFFWQFLQVHKSTKICALETTIKFKPNNCPQHNEKMNKSTLLNHTGPLIEPDIHEWVPNAIEK